MQIGATVSSSHLCSKLCRYKTEVLTFCKCFCRTFSNVGPFFISDSTCYKQTYSTCYNNLAYYFLDTWWYNTSQVCWVAKRNVSKWKGFPLSQFFSAWGSVCLRTVWIEAIFYSISLTSAIWCRLVFPLPTYPRGPSTKMFNF